MKSFSLLFIRRSYQRGNSFPNYHFLCMNILSKTLEIQSFQISCHFISSSSIFRHCFQYRSKENKTIPGPAHLAMLKVHGLRRKRHGMEWENQQNQMLNLRSSDPSNKSKLNKSVLCDSSTKNTENSMPHHQSCNVIRIIPNPTITQLNTSVHN